MKRISRRSFVKGTALGLAGVGLTPALAQSFPGVRGADAGAFRRVPATSVFGPMWANVEYGRVTNVSPLAEAYAHITNVDAMPDRTYSNARIRYPMVRRDFLAKRENSDRTQRGNGDFVRVSWDEALALVAAEMERVKGTYGNEALYTAKSSWGTNHAMLHRNEPMVHKLYNVFGGSSRFVGNYSNWALSITLPRVAWSSTSARTDWPTLKANVKRIVLWGADPLTTGRPRSMGYTATQWMGLRGAGVDVIAIDPMRNATARYLDAEWVPVRSNTDTALALGMMHTLLSEGLQDQAFLDKYTVGFDRFKDYLLGTTDMQPKDAAWAAGITGIGADKIMDLARRVVADRTMIVAGYGVQRQHHGEQWVWAMAALAAMIGQIGLPGGGLSFGYHSTSDGGFPGANMPSVSGFSAGSNPVKAYFPIARFVDAFENPGKTIDYNGTTLTYPTIKLAHGLGGNYLTQHQDTNRLIAGYQNVETIIQQEIWWTPSARFADIVLPAVSDLERNDLGQFANLIIGSHKAVDPIFESRSDYDILSELADRLGVAEAFNEGHDEMGWLQTFYDAAREKDPSGTMPDFDTFWNGTGVLEFEVKPGTQVHMADFREDPLVNALGTPSGKIEMYSETIAGYDYDDCPGHPAWLEPVEWVGGAMAKDYPLALVSKHNFYRIHSQMDNTWLRDMYKVDDREPVFINTQDAAARGIVTGDVVRVFNGRGQTLAGAVVTDDVVSGAVVLHEGSWYDPDQPGVAGALDKQGSANVLTLDEPLTSKLAQGTIAHTAVVQVEKYTGAATTVTAYEQPA
jgi:trimethylamine-N-oxide reductase (cytochrome c)